MWSVPGTSTCPMMCSRSMGMPYRAQIDAVSRAEDSYIALVRSFGRSTNPSCSMPTARSLKERLPAWYATSSSRIICTTRPS